MNIKHITLLIVAALTLSACDFILQPVVDESRHIKFAISSSGQQPEDGADLGIYAGTPLNKYNVKASFKAGKVETDNVIEWGSDQVDSCNFVAYTPYCSSIMDSEKYSGTIETEGHDLLIGLGRGCPGGGAIDLTFAHALSRLVFYVHNKTDEEIVSIEVGDVYSSVRVNFINGSVTPVGEKGTVSASKIASRGGVDAYAAVIPPQTATIRLIVTTSSKVYTEETPYLQTLAKGCQYQNEREFAIGGSLQHLSFVQTDWTDDLDWVYEDEIAPSGNIASIIQAATPEGAPFLLSVSDIVVSYIHDDVTFLEDESAAIMANVHLGINPGQMIAGNIKGVAQIVEGMPVISSLSTEYASISNGGQVPLHEVNLEELNANWDNYLSERIVVKGVTVTKGIGSTSRLGEISIEDQTAAIFACTPSDPATINAGVYGDLICFPSKQTDGNVLSVYETSHFTEMEMPEPPSTDTEFTETRSLPGVYSIDNKGAVTDIWVYESGVDQYGFGTNQSGRFFRLQSLSKGQMVSIQTSAINSSVGDVINVSTSAFGMGGLVESTSMQATIVMKAEGKIWIHSSDSNQAFIIAAE